jgi:uncharacterized RDD family membrane protein YckC
MMPASSKVDTLGEGVYYAPRGYAGLVRRCIIIGVDLLVVWFASVMTIVVLFDLPSEMGHVTTSKLFVLSVLSYLYLVLVKRSDWGTVGYRLTGVRIVNLEGKRPSVYQMTLRFLLFVFGPFHIIVDVLWLGGDENRQTLRDKIVGTYVIRDDALPAGRGQQQLVPYYLLGWNFRFREVKRAEPRSTADLTCG